MALKGLDELGGSSDLPPGGGGGDAIDLKKGSKSKTPLLIVVLLLAAVGIGFVVFKIKKGYEHDKQVAALVTRFESVEKEDVGAFWRCLFGKDADPGMFDDNLKLGARLEGAFMADPRGFPDKANDDCAPKLHGVAPKVDDLGAPEDYMVPLAAYKASLKGLEAGITHYAEQAKKRIVLVENQKKVTAAVNAFHATSGVPAPEALAWDHFLRCAIPDVDSLKDSQALLERLFNDCKKPEYVLKLKTECAPLASPVTDGKVDAKFKATLKKFGADDRDSSAIEDCFKKGKKEQKADDLTAFGQAWADYMKAGGDVRRQMKDELKKE